RVDGPLFLMVVAANDQGFARLGLAAARTLGGATRRNRAKRLLRESFRKNKLPGLGADLILLPKADILGRSQDAVEREYRSRLRDLLTRSATRAWGAAAAPADEGIPGGRLAGALPHAAGLPLPAHLYRLC